MENKLEYPDPSTFSAVYSAAPTPPGTPTPRLEGHSWWKTTRPSHSALISCQLDITKSSVRFFFSFLSPVNLNGEGDFLSVMCIKDYVCKQF
jgi:hypothetical protein